MNGETAKRIVIGLRGGRGGGVAVAVAGEADGPRVALSTFLPTAAEDDRLAFEPYHVAAEMMREAGGKVPPEAEAAVAEGRRRQAAMAEAGLKAMVGRLRDAGYEPAGAALLVNRAGWITDLLGYSLGAPEHPPVAEGLAVRDALRAACARLGIAFDEVDEKSLPQTASVVLGLSPGALDARLKDLGADAGKPWRKEQKAACLVAWLLSEGG